MSRRHRSGPARTAGFALTECLVALLLFSIAMAGTMTAQLAALRSTRAAIDHQRALRLLRDLGQERAWPAIAPAASAGPVVLPLDGEVPAVLDEWLAGHAGRHGGLGAATLCLRREQAVVRLALAWDSAGAADRSATAGCGDGRRSVALLEPVP